MQHTATLTVKFPCCFFICALVYKHFNYSDFFRNIPILRSQAYQRMIFILRKMGKHNKKLIRSLSLFIKLTVKSFTACTNLLSIKQFVTWP